MHDAIIIKPLTFLDFLEESLFGLRRPVLTRKVLNEVWIILLLNKNQNNETKIYSPRIILN